MRTWVWLAEEDETAARRRSATTVVTIPVRIRTGAYAAESRATRVSAPPVRGNWIVPVFGSKRVHLRPSTVTPRSRAPAGSRSLKANARGCARVGALTEIASVRAEAVIENETGPKLVGAFWTAMRFPGSSQLRSAANPS